MKQMKTVGLLTIGQSPRPDMTEDLIPIFKDKLHYIEAGALDGLTLKEVLEMKPEENEHYLVTRMQDGTVVTAASRHLYDRMQQKVTFLEESGASAILVLCTEAFQPFRCSIPVIYPNDVLKSLIPSKASTGHIGIILPEAGQMEDFAVFWKPVVPHVTAAHGSPYLNDGSLENAAKYLASTSVDLIVLDCMGYTAKMQKQTAEISGKPVFLAKTLAAEVLTEMI